MIILPKNKTLATVSGSISILIGLAALVWPSMTAQILAFLVGLFLLADALFSLFVRDRGALFTWTAVAQAVVGIIVALFLVVMPGAALQLLVTLIAVWIVLRAGIQLWGAIQLRGIAGASLFVGIIGGVSLLVGILLISNPEAGIIAFSWLIGVYAVVSGVVIVLWSRRSTEPPREERQV